MGFNTYNVGDTPRLEVRFTNADASDALFDPTAVFLRVINPENEVTNYEYGTDEEVQHDETGIYYAFIDADQDGRWLYKWWSTGTGQAAGLLKFFVRPDVTDV